MPYSEEEQRRRCIIDPSQCTTGLTQETALAELLAGYDGSEAGDKDYYRQAKGLLKDFTFADAHPGKLSLP